MSEASRVVCFRGKHVNLGLLEKDMDIRRCLAWVNDPEVHRFLGSTLPTYPTSEAEWFDNFPKRENDRVFAILLAGEDKRHIGNIGIHNIHWVHRTGISGTIIGEKDYWGRGYGTEAKFLLLHYVFNELGLEKVRSEVIEYNERSFKYALKCGYKEEGRFRKHIFRDGKRWDLIQLGILKEEFEEAWKKYQQTTS